MAGGTGSDTDVALLRGVEVEDREFIGSDLELINLGRCEAELLDDLGNGRCVETRGESGAGESEKAGGSGGGEHCRCE